MEQESWIHKFVVTLPFWWIVLTAIYVGLAFFLGGGYVASLLGLFVPIGVWNFFYSLEMAGGNRPWIITFPLVLLTVFGGEWLIRKINLSPALKVFVILGILFALTIAVDFIIWGNWQSLELLKAGGKICLSGVGHPTVECLSGVGHPTVGIYGET